MVVQWIISTDLGNVSDITEFVDAVKACCDIVYPVSLEDVLTPSYVPDARTDLPTIFYGAVNFVNRMSEQKQYQPGVYGDNDIYSYANLTKHIPSSWLFNNPDETVSGNCHDILESIKEYKDDMTLFFKPGDDSKFIVGSPKQVKDIKKICEFIRDGKMPDADSNSPLLLAPVYGIEKEYRLFVVNGKVVTGSEYNPGKQSTDIPKKVYDFASKVIAQWNPEPVFILDVCLSAGNPYIMEIQNFHSAGHYAADKIAIVKAVDEMAKRDFIHN